MEMFKSGDGVDCVIEVQQSDGKEKVFFNIKQFIKQAAFYLRWNSMSINLF
jgi:hypothetical protein